MSTSPLSSHKPISLSIPSFKAPISLTPNLYQLLFLSKLLRACHFVSKSILYHVNTSANMIPRVHQNRTESVCQTTLSHQQPSPTAGDITLIGAHGNGFVKVRPTPPFLSLNLPLAGTLRVTLGGFGTTS